jgi:hypothetical protein
MVIVVEKLERHGVVMHHPQQTCCLLPAQCSPVRQRGDQPDRLLQFPEAALIDRVAPKDVVAQHLSSPDTELGAALGVDPVTDRDDGVQTIECDRLVRTGNVHFLHIAFFFKLSALKDVAQMLCDNTSFRIEKESHLLLAEPNGIPFQPDVQLDRAVGRLIKHNLAALGSQRFSDHLMLRC